MMRNASRGPAALLALALALAATVALTSSVQAQQSKPAQEREGVTGQFSVDETMAIREIIRDYLLENPEVIMEAVQVLRQREQQAADARRKSALQAHRQALSDPGPLPVMGNPDGDVTIVEFFDYRCPYCRRVVSDLLETVATDGNVRLVMKEYPILGEESVLAARAAIAAARQGAYEDFHIRLMTEVQEVGQASVMRLAGAMGLDVDKLRADMRADWVDQELRRTRRLAQALEVGGTPAFVVGGELVPGAVPAARLRQLIALAREQQG